MQTRWEEEGLWCWTDVFIWRVTGTVQCKLEYHESVCNLIAIISMYAQT